jgi:flagellar biosynthesis protein FlhB
LKPSFTFFSITYKRILSGFASFLNLSFISSEYIKTYPSYSAVLCLPVLISSAVFSSFPSWVFNNTVASIFPLIPYFNVLNYYSIPIKSMYCNECGFFDWLKTIASQSVIFLTLCLQFSLTSSSFFERLNKLKI